MSKKITSIIIPDELIMNKIYLIRGQKVMIDRDLAVLYEVQTKRLKESVKRNLKRFPEDFMFEMNKTELENWRSQIATSNSDKMGLRYSPFCFTEHGVLMLSSVLNSDRAIDVNIKIMRIFTQIKQALTDNTELRLAIEKLEKKTENNTKNIEIVFQYIDELSDKKAKQKPRIPIGFKIKKKK
ncbi:MAG: DNA-binding protein [Bacteroidetes bacterium RIFCSPLOWO2_12_FULL_35_15]|nr:MAG: DNA-binding protein [Bacteroidetes bacterium RIFCSPLOWO2_12_FULL_35_15]